MKSIWCNRSSEEEFDKMLDQILKKDKRKDEKEDSSSSSCSAECGQANFAENFCECIRIAENSSRFSLRVMEAMRALQNDEDDFLPTSSVEDIVDYIRENYRDDGDLCAQVRTALKQLVIVELYNRFVIELHNQYYLLGPDAASMNRMEGSYDSEHPKNGTSKNPCICENPFDKERGVEKKGRRIFRCGLNPRKRTSNCHNDEVMQCTYGNGKRMRSRRRISIGDARDRVIKRFEEVDEDDSEINDSEDIEESQSQIELKKKKQTEKELERWINRCQKECERQNRRS